MDYIKLLNYGSVITAFLAAIFWFLSAYAKGEADESPDDSGFISASIGINGGDLAATMKKQSKYSAIAATFAGVASICQALVLHFG